MTTGLRLPTPTATRGRLQRGVQESPGNTTVSRIPTTRRSSKVSTPSSGAASQNPARRRSSTAATPSTTASKIPKPRRSNTTAVGAAGTRRQSKTEPTNSDPSSRTGAAPRRSSIPTPRRLSRAKSPTPRQFRCAEEQTLSSAAQQTKRRLSDTKGIAGPPTKTQDRRSSARAGSSQVRPVSRHGLSAADEKKAQPRSSIKGPSFHVAHPTTTDIRKTGAMSPRQGAKVSALESFRAARRASLQKLNANDKASSKASAEDCDTGVPKATESGDKDPEVQDMAKEGTGKDLEGSSGRRRSARFACDDIPTENIERLRVSLGGRRTSIQGTDGVTSTPEPPVLRRTSLRKVIDAASGDLLGGEGDVLTGENDLMMDL